MEQEALRCTMRDKEVLNRDIKLNQPYKYWFRFGIVGSVAITRLLLAAGADPNALNSEKRTPIHYALAFGHAQVAGLLWKAGADLTLPDKNGVRYIWKLLPIVCVIAIIEYNWLHSPLDLVENPGAVSPEVRYTWWCYLQTIILVEI